ncbi:ABC transporter permease [Cohnella faecalis]|uniref:Putative hemin transport system permease protein HrtB n=2 Tax=Cohnella faecalis TaxID=2315694 RepID=A0A398CS67_9BACL|nr:ABC transporter permease [Cohnella faecalis]
MAWRNLANRKVQTIITILVVVIGVAVTLSIMMLSGGIKQGIVRASEPYGMIVGSKGSANQLVFNTIFLMDNPLANIDQAFYEKLSKDERVSLAVPFALGDNYRGFRVVGTDVSFFGLKGRPVDPPYFRLSSGRLFERSFEAIIGSDVARQTGLKLGDRFAGAHGVAAAAEPEEHAEHPYTVVGVLDAVSAPSDQGIYVSIDSYWIAHEHEEETADGATASAGAKNGSGSADADDKGSEAAHSENGEISGEHPVGGSDEENRGVTAALIKPKSYVGLLKLYQEINAGKDAQAVLPGQVLAKLFDMMGGGERVLRDVGYVVLGMAALTVALALYGSTVERRRTVAILRAIGAGRLSVMTIVLLESALVMVIGCALGTAAGYGLTELLTRYIGTQVSIAIPTAFEWEWLSFIGGVALLGIAAGLFPAFSAYRTETARYLNA